MRDGDSTAATAATFSATAVFRAVARNVHATPTATASNHK